MSAQQHLASVNHADRDLYARERVLNSVIIGANISRGWEEYLDIFDAFYADDVEVTTDIGTGPARGRDHIRALLFNFLAPLPTSTEIAKCWEDVHIQLLSRFKTLRFKEWLERHGNVSPEEFEGNPARNRLAVLLGRTMPRITLGK